ncbi:MAG: FlgD immunoglobulin-like domain containing protein [bacterium]
MKTKVILIFVSFFVVSFLSFTLVMRIGWTNNPKPVELFFSVDVENSDSTVREFTARNVGGLVWDRNFEITSGFQDGSIQIIGNEPDQGFSHTAIPPDDPSSPTLGYGLYKISIEVGGNAWFKIDFRNCGYFFGAAPYPNGDQDSDIDITYDPAVDKFYWTPNSQTKKDITGKTIDLGFFKGLDTLTTCFERPDTTPPSAPQNLVLVNSGQNGQNPILQWDANTEPDLDHYQIYRGDQDFPGGSIFWHSVATASNTNWTDPWITIDTSGPATVYYKITAVDQSGNESDFSNTVSTKTDIIPKPSANPIEKGTSGLPQQIILDPNYPNPFNPSTLIPYQLPHRGTVLLEVYNLAGQKIRTLVHGLQPAGDYREVWDGRDALGRQVASGIYLVQLKVVPEEAESAPFRQVRKITLMR